MRKQVFSIVTMVALLTIITTTNAKAQVQGIDNWTLQVTVETTNTNLIPTITVQGPNYSDSVQGTSNIFTVPGNTIQPGDTYTVCAITPDSNVCREFTHSPGDSESVTLTI